jgi:hypothetical protein
MASALANDLRCVEMKTTVHTREEEGKEGRDHVFIFFVLFSPLTIASGWHYPAFWNG